MMNKKELTELIDNVMSNEILHDIMKDENVNQGDIAPEQLLVWDDCCERLADLMIKIVEQNRPKEEDETFYAIVKPAVPDTHTDDDWYNNLLNEWHVIKSDYVTKDQFREDLYGNGYIILNEKIYTEQEYKELD